MNLRERILSCKNPNELNSLRVLLVSTERETFLENQEAFIKMKNKFSRITLKERDKDFGEIYNPNILQQKI